MKHIVYKFIFKNRLTRNDPPFYYIGSKSNCAVKDGFIIDKQNKKYFGSSNSKLYKEAIKDENPILEILGEFQNYNECLQYERQMHIENDVAKNHEYFNLSIACDKSTYTNPDYCTVRHKDYPNKFIRMRKDDPLILNGTFINANAGYKTYNNGIIEKQFLTCPLDENWVLGKLKSNILYGEKNGFYGKTHSNNTKEKIINGRNKYYENHPDEMIKNYNRIGEYASKNLKGKPLSDEHKQKLGKKGFVTVKNILTNEWVQIHKDEFVKIDKNIWKAAGSFTTSSLNTRWCNNGKINLKLKENETLPSGYEYGRLLCFKPQSKGYWAPWETPKTQNNENLMNIYSHLIDIIKFYDKIKIENLSIKDENLLFNKEFPQLSIYPNHQKYVVLNAIRKNLITDKTKNSWVNYFKKENKI
jgi:hypothetical protein